jgi:hypothetical protein
MLAIVILSGILSGWTIYLALISPRNEAAGWWQVGIEFLGLPLIISGLVEIQKKIKELSLRPEIILGLFGNGPISYIREGDVLPAVTVNASYPFFQLVVRNQGDLVAKYVKILFEFESVGDFSYQKSAHTSVEKLAAPKLTIPEDNPFKWHNNKDFIFTGGSDWFIYPHDNVAFGFFLSTTVEGQHPIPHEYHFRCTLWAEGLENAVSEDLVLVVVNNND